MRFYMYSPGIKGSVKFVNYLGWSELIGVHAGDDLTGGGRPLAFVNGERRADHTRISNLTVTKPMELDGGYLKFFDANRRHTHFEHIVIDTVRVDGHSLIMRIVLKDATIASYSIRVDSALSYEMLNIEFKSINYNYTAYATSPKDK